MDHLQLTQHRLLLSAKHHDELCCGKGRITITQSTELHFLHKSVWTALKHLHSITCRSYKIEETYEYAIPDVTACLHKSTESYSHKEYGLLLAGFE